jgi:ATP-binding cassette subfamily B multidrug efflux pump
MDQAFYQRERTGDLMTKMSSDLSAVRELVGQGLLQGSRMVVGFPLAFGVMFATNTRMALIVTALLPFVSILFFFLMRLVRKYYERAQDQFSLISNFAQESFAGIRTLKGFGIEERQRGRFRALNEEYIRRNMTLTRIEEPVWPFMMFLYWVGAVLLLLTGGRQVLDNQLTIGTYVQFQQYLIFLQWPMLALGWTVNILQRGLASWRRIRTILDARPEVADPPGAPDPGSTRGDIEFRGVRLRRGGQLLLDGIDLRIPSGQCLALTGPTGSGKTLLMSLLVRLLDPDEGLVTIGGRDVRAWPLPSLRRRIALAPQEPFLFSDTLANNLAFGLEVREDALTAHEERVAWAARLAHLEQDVAGFPERYQTVLGERGVTLSGRPAPAHRHRPRGGAPARCAAARRRVLRGGHPDRGEDPGAAAARAARAHLGADQPPRVHAAPRRPHHRAGRRPHHPGRLARPADRPARLLPRPRRSPAPGRPPGSPPDP